jgi:glucose 1-dehydrogenase
VIGQQVAGGGMGISLAGKVAIVTGGARGIGRAIAQTLADAGARVAVVDRNAAPGPESGPDSGGDMAVLTADVGDYESAKAMVAEVIRRFGQIDLLVNNAGIVSRKSLLDVPLGEWADVLRTNLDGCFYCTRLVAGHLVARAATGRIVNISSIHGRVAKANMGAYCTSKAAIDMLTKQFAVELGPHGITVNAVAPGTIATDINIPLYRSNAPADVTLKRVPLGHLGEPSDIANMVAFLCSDAARYVTGSVHYVDGGYTAEGTPRA